MNYGIVLFKTTANAMKTEKMLTQEGYNVTVVPAPREFATGCGIAVRFPWSQGEAIKTAVEQSGIEIQGIHEVKS